MKNKLILLLLSAFGQKKPKRETSDRGFTLIEVIVAMVILSVFIVASLSALVAGLNLKLKAKLNNEATLLIQQDLERVRYVAASSNIATVGSTLPTAVIASRVITVTLPINNPLSNFSSNPILKAGTAITGYTLASSTATSISMNVDVTKTIKTTTLTAPSNTPSASPIIRVIDGSKFVGGQRVLIGSSTSTNVFVGTISSISVNEITFSTNVNAAYPIGTAVTLLPSSGETVADISACPDGIADQSMANFSSISLATTFPPSPTVSPNPFTNVTTTQLVLAGSPTKTIYQYQNEAQVGFNGRNYQITRIAKEAPEPTTTDPTASDPRNFSNTKVQLKYSVLDKATTSTTTLAELTTEVIPNVTFQCP